MPDQTKTLDSSEIREMPDDELESGTLGTISFDGVDMQIRRLGVAETYFVLEPPDATPILYAGAGATNRELLAFVDRRLADLKRMRAEMLKRFSKGASTACRYDTGDVVRVFGRPFMVHVAPAGSRSALKKGSRGRASTGISVDNEISLIQLNVIQTGNYDQRRGTFYNWACAILRNNAAHLCREVVDAMGVDEAPPETFRTRPMSGELVKIDAVHGIVWLSEDLVPLSPVCLKYAYARRLAEDVTAQRGLVGEEAAQARRDLVERGCPAWREAKAEIDAAGLAV